MELLKAEIEKVTKRLRAVAFTDSVHSFGQADPKPVRDFIISNAIQWECSEKPLDTLLQEKSHRDCRCVSAGTPGSKTFNFFLNFVSF